MKIKFVIVLLLSAIFTNAQVTIKNLRCEMLINPQGIDVLQPRFSWQLISNQKNVQQLAYQIIVASSNENLAKNFGDIWDSKKISSSQSVLVTYAGTALQPATKYYFKIKSFTNKGEAILNETAFFSTGLLSQSNWKAKWIGYDKASPWDSITQFSRLSARYLRKEFQSPKDIKRATVYISGLGLYELFINGKKIGNQVLAPNPTDYRKSVFYNTHDVTTQIKNGNNAIAAVLGNGRFFTMRQNYKTQKHNTFGYPKLLLQLEIEYADGSKKIIVSNETWKLNVDGPIRTNNEYDGEEYDATKEFGDWASANFNDTKWLQPEIVEAPPGKLIAQMSEPIKEMQSLIPISIKKINEEKFILDMGQNFSGLIKLKNIVGKKGEKIKFCFAESLKPNGELFTANLRDAKVTDIYTCKGNVNEIWQPSFIYHGFRYVEISTAIKNLTIKNFEGKLIYDDIATTGSFETSNKTINAIYKNAWWGMASNYKGMPIDCPQRNERQPWLGDRAIGEQGESFVFDNAKLYAKWMDDIEQSQTTEGAIPDVAPAFWNYYSDNVTWPATFITVSNNLYNQFGDINPIKKHYASMKKWMTYMKDKYLVNYIMTKDKYGDWCVPPESLQLIHAKDSSRITDGKLIATAYYYKLLLHMQRFAMLTNNTDDIKAFALLSDSIKTNFQKIFYNPTKKYYGNNTVTANLLPLYFGICPDTLKENIVANIYKKIHEENKDHISTGVIGTQFLMRALTELGYKDLAYTLASNTTYPSWGYMAANGATTIWELWNGNTADPNMNSQNHVMLLGDLITWFYENLAGIKTDTTEVGFKKIIMKPTIPANLQFVNASYKSIYGIIKSNWKKSNNIFNWDISIPTNTIATVYLPVNSYKQVVDNIEVITKNKEIHLIKADNEFIVLNIPSGNYSFTIK